MAHTKCPLLVVDAAVVDTADLERLSRSRGPCSLLVLARDPGEEMAAVRAGARATLRKPVSASLVAWHLGRIKECATQAGAKREAIELEATRGRAECVQHLEAVITHEMASPLVVVLANAGFMREQIKCDRKSDRANWQELDQIASEIESSAERVQRSVSEMRGACALRREPSDANNAGGCCARDARRYPQSDGSQHLFAGRVERTCAGIAGSSSACP